MEDITNIMKKMKLNDYVYSLKIKYSDVLIDNKKTSNELCNYIKNKFDVIDVSNEKDSILREKNRFRLNCLASWYNEDNYLQNEDLILKSYIIINNFKSISYYQKFEKKYLLRPIYIIVEVNTGYISSNCDRINNELYLYRGVSNFDIKNNSPDLSLYLRLLDEKEEYK